MPKIQIKKTKKKKRPLESIDDDYRMVECMKNAMYTLKNQIKKPQQQQQQKTSKL